jgi:Cupin superfamily protein
MDLENSDLRCLDELLSPISGKEFLQQNWGCQFLHVAGPKDKFKALFSWNLLNSALEQNRFEPQRLRLYRGGNEIPSERYLEFPPIQGRNVGRRIKMRGLMDELRRGSTLILNYADEISPTLRDLAISLERIFRRYIIANLYIAVGSDNGFALHWDDHDTLIVQVSGRKRWLIYEAKSTDPIYAQAPPRPDSNDIPVWDGLLEEGSLFHIPRGWWHVAYPVNDPSLHLTITVKSHTGHDMLRWVMETLKSSALIRGNLPLWASPEAQEEYVQSLKQLVTQAWPPDLFGQFMDYLDSSASPRPQLRLPYAAIASELKMDENTQVKLSSAGRIVLVGAAHEGVVNFKYNGKTKSCSERLIPALTLANDGAKHALREFTALGMTPADSVAIGDFVQELIQTGVLVTEALNV